MKKLATAALAASLLLAPGGVRAETTSCVNLDAMAAKKLLTDTANRYGVPAEIVKGIAASESAGFKQCNQDGTPIISRDGGIGMMQITLNPGEHLEIDRERLKTDAAYNVDQGVKILKEKYSFDKSPTIVNQSMDSLEHWYFAVRNYNGNTASNDPTKNPGGTYQERVYRSVQPDTTPFPLENYNSNWKPGDQPMQWAYGYTPTMSNLQAGDQVLTNDSASKLRDTPSTGVGSKVIGTFTENSVVTIKSSVKYEDPSVSNLFIFYQVEVNGKKGYMASSVLKPLRIENSNPIAAQEPVNIPDGKVKILLNTPIYNLVNGQMKPGRTATNKEALRVYGTKGIYYHVGGSDYVKHDPAKTKMLIGVALSNDKARKPIGFITEDHYSTITLDNGKELDKKNIGGMVMGYVKLKSPVTLTNGSSKLALKANTWYRVYTISGRSYDVGGGYSVAKSSGNEYSPVFGGK
ncbi:hypothetical protein CEF21_21040 [Bacillus sp. FJAT-42376]|uniref:transglycosylase SLT domain-containing protein n=1 Tax=Bacillus sp. FJAT-42376 TaxID=2014076 RepID=UPI000F4D57A7|nr:transglycosylase SLT domain-containing protein [Bacillus sp. FJAT-42376]AZB44570.1 hypothetical protein CEF21_21040 [Bacillus sp. FJAT-42376]